jgi:hypothetical protein
MPSHQGIVSSIDSIETSTDNLNLLIEDIAMTSLITVLALSAAGLGHSYASAQCPTKTLPCPQAPTKCPPAPCKTLPCAQAPSKVAPCPQAPAKCAPVHCAPQAPVKAAPQY